MSQCNFHVGQKVVFVGTGNISVSNTVGVRVVMPEVGRIYSIASIHLLKRGDCFFAGRIVEDVVCIKLQEMPGTGYEAAWFRPVVPRKTSIKIFTDILKEVEAKEPVEGLPW